MPRHLGTERRHPRHAFRFTLLLALLIASAFVRVAEAAAPPPPPGFQGTFTSPGMCSPRGIGLSPSGDVYVGSDCDGPHMVRFTASGALLGTWGFPGGYVGSPNGVALDGSGNVFVTDYDAHLMHKFTSAGALVTTWGSSGSGPGQFAQPVDIVVNGAGDVFVVELTGRRVQKFTNGGAHLMTIGSAGGGPGQFVNPTGIGVDASGRIYVADAGRLRVLRFLANGSFDMEFATTSAPYDVAEGADGNLYVVFAETNSARQYSPSGVLLQAIVSPAGLDIPYRIACGPTGSIYITEQFNNRVSKFQIDATTSAERTTFARLKAMYR